MRKNKLLPFLGIGVACASVAPIMLTSCNNNKQVNLMEVYVPSIKKAEKFSSAQDEDTIIKWYFNSVKNKTEIFRQDFYYAHSIYTNYLTSNHIVSMVSATININNIKFSTITPTEGDVTPALSCEIKYNYAGYPGTESGVESKYQGLLFEGNFTFKLKNVPMRMSYYTNIGEPSWIPGWAVQILTKETSKDTWVIPTEYDNLWEIEQEGKVNIIDENSSEGIYHRIVYPFETVASAKNAEEYLANLVNQNPITTLSITDISTSHYMAKMNKAGI